jgi:transposase
MPTSPASLIALIRQTALLPTPTPRVLGVDDWAKRRGRSHGTILVDLEAHRPIDLLPDRRAETLATWLQAHPGVDIITRDRAGMYAEGATRGAPTAVQVADRWHLMQNWAEVVERVLIRHQRVVRQIQVVTPLPHGAPTTALLPLKSGNRQRHYADVRREQARQHREERWAIIRDRHVKGISLADIARELRLNYKTVRKYANATACPPPPPTPPRHGRMTPYVPYLHARWAEGCHNGAKLAPRNLGAWLSR